MCDFVCGTLSCAKLSLHWSMVSYTLSDILDIVQKYLFLGETSASNIVSLKMYHFPLEGLCLI